MCVCVGGGGGVGNNGKLKKTLKSLVNGNRIFDYDTQLESLDSPSVAKIQSQALVAQQRRRYDAA